MSSFHDLFREYLSQRGLTVYRLSKELQMERSTLYQVQNGTRLPTAQMLRRISAYLQLTPLEEQNLLRAWKQERLGPQQYQLRQRVEVCIQSLEQYAKKLRSAPRIRRKVILDIPQGHPIILEGRRESADLIKGLVEEQFSSRNPAPIDIHLPFQTLSECCGCLERVDASPDSPSIRQLFPLSPPGQARTEDLSSMVDLLSDVLTNFFSPRGYCRYIPYFYYDNGAAENNLSSLFPYYIITSQHLAMFNEGLNLGLVFSDGAVVEAFRQQFETSLGQARPLLRQYASPIQAIEDIQPLDPCSAPETPSVHFFRQPCFAMLADQDIVARCIHPDCPDRDQVIELAMDHYIRRHTFGPNDYNFFTRSGAAAFLADGVMREFPSKLLLPLSLEERLTLLRRLRRCAGEEGWNIRCIDEHLVSVPENVLIDICFGRQMLFSRSQPEDLSYLVISEPNLIQCFFDYFRSLPTTPGVSSLEDTVAVLDELLAPYS